MKTQLLTGSKQEIAERVAALSGNVREAIIFIEDQETEEPKTPVADDMFAEMAPYTVRADGVDYSR